MTAGRSTLAVLAALTLLAVPNEALVTRRREYRKRLIEFAAAQRIAS
jgi:Tfp pilus assembly protein FimT